MHPQHGGDVGGSNGSKRKSTEADLGGREDESLDEGIQGDSNSAWGSGTLGDFYEPNLSTLGVMHALISSPPPVVVEEVHQLAQQFLEYGTQLCGDKLVKPRYGLTKAHIVLDELRIQLTERPMQSPGPLEWARLLDQEFAGFANMDEDEQGDTLRGVAESMELFRFGPKFFSPAIAP